MTWVSYKCKICGLDRVASYDETCPIQDLSKWVSMLTCNRCYDFRDKFTSLCREISAKAYRLILARQSKREKELSEIESASMEAFNALTKTVCTLVSNHYHAINIWDQSLVTAIFEYPGKAWELLRSYKNSVSVVSQKPPV